MQQQLFHSCIQTQTCTSVVHRNNQITHAQPQSSVLSEHNKHDLGRTFATMVCVTTRLVLCVLCILCVVDLFSAIVRYSLHWCAVASPQDAELAHLLLSGRPGGGHACATPATRLEHRGSTVARPCTEPAIAVIRIEKKGALRQHSVTAGVPQCHALLPSLSPPRTHFQ